MCDTGHHHNHLHLCCCRCPLLCVACCSGFCSESYLCISWSRAQDDEDDDGGGEDDYYFVKSLISFASVMGGCCWWSMLFVFLLWVEEQAKYWILSLSVQILEYREKSGLWKNRFAGDWLRELSVVVFVQTVACLLKCVSTSSLTISLSLSLSLSLWKGGLEILLTGCEASKRYLTWWVSLSFFLWLKFGCWIGFCFKSLLCYVVGLWTEVVLVISSMLGFFLLLSRGCLCGGQKKTV